MASVQYSEIFSRFFSRVEAYDFITLSNDDVNGFLTTWLHSACNNPYVRRLFSSMSLDDEIQTMDFAMKYNIDNDMDLEFVLEILGVGMVIGWLTPKINSIQFTAQMFGSKESKFFSQSAHLSELRNLRQELIKEQRRMIADRGYANNSYLDGE